MGRRARIAISIPHPFDSAGVTLQRLMEDWFAATLGLAYPSRNADAEGKGLARAVVEDVMGELLPGNAIQSRLVRNCSNY